MYDVLYMDTAGVVAAEVEIRFDTRRGGLFGGEGGYKSGNKVPSLTEDKGGSKSLREVVGGST